MQLDREMLRSITGRSRRQGGGRVHGGTSLGLTREIPFTDMELLAQELLADYLSLDYRTAFSSLDRLQALPREATEAARLTQALIDSLRSPEPAAFLAPRTMLDWEHVSGFRYSTQRRGRVHDEPDLSTYLSTLGNPADLTLDRLRQDEIRVVDRDSPRTIATWSVLRSLVWETSVDDNAYILSDGRWYLVDRAYLEW